MESQMEKRARKRLREFEKTAAKLAKHVEPLQRALLHLLSEVRQLTPVASTADSLSAELQTILSLLTRVSGTDRMRARVAEASRRQADSMVGNLREQPSASRQPTPRPQTSPPPQPGARPAQPLLRGSTKALPIAGVIELLATWSKSGTLSVTTEQETVRLTLIDGDIVRAVSDSPPAGARLGEVLVDNGAIEEHDLTEFLQRHASASTRIGDALASEELVTSSELRAAIEQQIQLTFDRVFSARDATFSFLERGGNDGSDEDDIRLGVTQLLLESARASDEANRAPQTAMTVDDPELASEAPADPGWSAKTETRPADGTWDDPHSP